MWQNPLMGKTYQRTVDRLGRIVVPAEIRQALQLGPGARLGFALDDTTLVLEPVGPRCVFLHSQNGTEELAKVNGRLVCEECRQGLMRLRDGG